MKARKMYRQGSEYGIGALALVCALAVMPSTLWGAGLAGGSSKEHAHGYLGIEFHDTTDEEIASLHLQGPHGAEVIMVDHDGPAGKAGLQPHDIVLQMDGQNIDSSDDLSRRIRESVPGRVISLSIIRLGHAITMTAKLANREELERKAYNDHLALPSPPPPDDGVDNILVERYTIIEPTPSPRTPSRGQSFIGTVLRSGPYTGASLETMEPQLASYFGAPPKTGLLVHAVDNNSPAAIAGLQAGDVVLRIDLAPVASTSDWTKHLRAAKGRPLTLLVLRQHHEQTLTLTPDAKKHSMLEVPPLPFHGFPLPC